MTSLIVDDEPIARSIIESYIKQLNNWDEPVSCNNGIEAMEVLNKGYSPDVMFLDINMPVINGIDFLRTLKNPPVVVLTTAYKEFAVDAFELQAADYLVKPISFERFLKTIQHINELYFPANEIVTPKPVARDFIFLKHNGKMQKVTFVDIQYIEAKGDYINVVMGNQTLLISMQMKEIEECLPQDSFMRVHRSFIVNLRRVNVVYGNTIEMEKKEIPIGSNYKDAFLKLITDSTDLNT